MLPLQAKKNGILAWRRWIAVVALSGLLAIVSAKAEAQSSSSRSLQLPRGAPIRYPAKPTSLQFDWDGSDAVGQLLVTAGDTLVVMRPDGKLQALPREATKASTTPFEAETHEQIAARLTASGPLKGFRSHQTRRYLYLYNTSEEFALATSRILETMFQGVALHAQALKLEVHPPPVPMVVVMFKTQEQYRAYSQLPRGIVAFYSSVDNHVVMCEETGLEKVHAYMARQQALSTIAHEGAHQILHNIGIQKRLSRWPMWLSEGLAEYFAPTSTDQRLKWKGAGQVNDLRMFELELFIKSGAAAPGKMVEDTVLARRLTSTGYASAWALTHYLAKNHRVAFNELVREASQLRPLESLGPASGAVIPKNREQFVRHFGGDFPALEGRTIAHLKKLPYRVPFAHLPHFVALTLTGEGRKIRRYADVFHRRGDAELWCRRILQAADNVGKSIVQPAANRAAAAQQAQRWLRGR